MKRTWIVIKQITKKEMEYLMKKGFKFHEDIFKTYSGNSKYYYRECREINKALDNYHNGLHTRIIQAKQTSTKKNWISGITTKE